jgi:protoheme ferro-lyase
MAYGSPDRLADVPAYYADIRGGRPIREELLDDLVARYRALGIDDTDASSPLNAITEETRAALEDALGIRVLTGMRHWQPRIAAAPLKFILSYLARLSPHPRPFSPTDRDRPKEKGAL